MATTFCLLSYLAFSHYRVSRRKIYIVAVFVAYSLAFLSKETALLLPVVFAILVISSKGEGDAPGSAMGVVALAAFLGACYAILRFGFMSNPNDAREYSLAAGRLVQGLPVFFAIVFDLTGRFFLPWPLAPAYTHPHPTWGHPESLAGMGLSCLYVGAIWLGIRRKDVSLSVPLAWFVTGLSPLGYALVSPEKYYAYDRYLYLPSIGLVWLCVATAVKVRRSVAWARAKPSAHAFGLVAMLLLAAFASIVVDRNEAWSSGISLWSDAVLRQPGEAGARVNLGAELLNNGDHQGAETRFKEALELEPTMPEAHYNLARLQLKVDRLREAEMHFRAAIRLNARLPEAHNGLGRVFFKTERLSEALDEYEKSLALRPSYVPAHMNAGDVLVQLELYPEAWKHYTAALRAQPRSTTLLNKMGLCLIDAGRKKAAANYFERAIRMDSENAEAHFNLGLCLEELGQKEKAAQHYRQTLRLSPNHEEAEQRLAGLGR